MVIVWILLALLAVFAICWPLCVYGIRKTTGFHGLAGYHYAHRGLHAKERGLPENSLRAFRLAAEAGYGAELDVRLSKDGQLVVMHDESLLRTCGVNREVCDLTAEELREYRLGETEEKIPFLEEVLPIFAGRQPLVIELKTVHNNAAELTSKVCMLLQEYPDLKFCVESFDPRVLIWLRKNKPQIIRGQLSCDLLKDEANIPLVQRFLLKNLALNFYSRPHFVAYRLEDRNALSFRLCRKLWGVQEFNWTVQSQADAQKAVQDGRVIIFEGFRPLM